MTVSLQFPVFLGAVVVIGPVTPGPTSPSLAADILKYSNAQGAVLPPALIDGLCDDDEGLRCLRNLDHLYFAGAPLSRRSAEKLISHVPVRPAMGSTEAGAYFVRIIDRDLDWEYYSFRPGMGLKLQHVADGMYGAVFVRKEEVERWQQVFRVYPELDEFRTKDLFVRHPEKEDLWVSSPPLLIEESGDRGERED
jgi:acyl-coenzyme A synthetase/AMP-(fatty) acid ligase